MIDNPTQPNLSSSAADILAGKPSNLHKGSKGAPVDIQELIDKSVCADVYVRLENCLGENDRSWKICQTQVILHNSIYML